MARATKRKGNSKYKRVRVRRKGGGYTHVYKLRKRPTKRRRR